jgi:drug/metabolite transporter (DMT)-like permease
VRTEIALVLVGATTVLGLVLVFGLWHRLPERVALATAGAIGMALGAGVLLLQEDPGPWDWVAALGILAVGTPLHCRMVFGRPGSVA